ncbi:MAG: ATP-binding protein [Pseudomonadota bacterium]
MIEAKSDTSLDLLFEKSVDLICEVDRQGGLRRVSQSWSDQLGWEPRLLVGRPLADLTHRDDRLSDLLRPNQPIQARNRVIRFRMKHANGQFVQIDWTSLSLGRDRLLVTGRKAAAIDLLEEAGLAPEIRLARAIDHIPVAFALYDEDDRLVISNRCYEATFSTPPVPMVPGTRFEMIVRAFAKHHGIGACDSDRARWIARRLNWREAPARALQFEYGDSHWAEINDFALPQDQMITVAVDVTEKRRAEIKLDARDRQLRRLQSELTNASRMTAMAHLSSVLGHELSQPLAAIANYAQAARRRLQSLQDQKGDELQSLLQQTAEQSQRAKGILSGLRSLAQTGDPSLCLEDLNRDVETATRVAVSASEEDRVEIDFRPDDDLPPVMMNRLQIQQVVVNLVRNAIQAVAGSMNETIEVTTARVDGDLVEVSVADRGPGLPDDVRANLFKPFVTTKHDGMGLGLSICHSLIDAHGGTIQAEENLGGGTRFRFRLPLNHGEANSNGL